MITVEPESAPNQEIKLSDIKGDLHFHLTEHGDHEGNWTGSTDSEIEGENYIEWALRELPGISYIAVTDHLEQFGYDKGRFHTGDKYGVEHLYDSPELIEPQLERVRELNGYQGMIVIAGIEASIQKSGRINATNRVLEMFDLVIASDHYYQDGGDASEVTRRYLEALKNPQVDILGHPARKHLEWIEIDWLTIAQAAKDANKAIEINMTPVIEYGIPERKNVGYKEPSRNMDILRILARTGVKISIGGDTHKIQSLRDNAPIRQSQVLALHKLIRDLNVAGISKSQILNTYSADEIIAWARMNNR